MLTVLARNWWVFALQGAAAILFGVLALVWPGLTLVTLILLFGAYVLVDGVFSVIAGIAPREGDRNWGAVLRGVAGIIIGLAVFFWPGTTAVILLYFIAAWAIITGILAVVAGIQWRRVITGEWVMILGGVASILFGLLLVTFPGAGALAVVWLIGIYAIALGILFLILAFRLRGMLQEGETGGTSDV